MYTINDVLNETAYSGFQAEKILDINAKEILQISLEKNAIFPKHTSPTDATLLVLEGSILFYINEKVFTLSRFQFFDFPKEIEHWVKAVDNSKFIIIR